MRLLFPKSGHYVQDSVKDAEISGGFSIHVKCLHQACLQKLLLLTCKMFVGVVYSCGGGEMDFRLRRHDNGSDVTDTVIPAKAKIHLSQYL